MRWSVFLASIITLVLCDVLAADAIPGAIAPEATPLALTTHPIVGTWMWDNNPDNPGADISYAIFHADGSYVETSAFNGTALGAWQATGERSVLLIETFLDIDESPAVAPGTATFLIALTVDERGTTFMGLGAVQVRSPAGEVTFEANRLSFRGKRVTVAPLPEFGAWTAGTPVVGTPTP